MSYRNMGLAANTGTSNGHAQLDVVVWMAHRGQHARGCAAGPPDGDVSLTGPQSWA